MDVVLMTKSRKNGHFCIAGIDLYEGKWVRLISNDDASHGAVPKEDLTFEDGNEAQILDIVRVTLKAPKPLYFQPENIEYDPGFYWEKIRSCTLDEVTKILKQSKDPYVFFDSAKKISEPHVKSIGEEEIYSLKLLHLASAKLKVKRWNPTERIKHTISFRYNSSYYNFLNITDDDFTKKYPAEGDYSLFDITLVISLGEIHFEDQHHYKLVASVL